MIVHTTKLVQVNLGKGEWLFAWSPRPNRETTRLTLPSYYISRPLMSQTQPSLLRQTLLPNLPLSSLLERAEVSCQGHFSWHGYLVLLLWLSIELEAIGYSGEFSVLQWRQDLTNFAFYRFDCNLNVIFRFIRKLKLSTIDKCIQNDIILILKLYFK